MTTRLSYSGTALPTDSDTFVLFSTQGTGFWSGFLQHTCTKRFVVDIQNSHAGTLNTYKSDDGGTNWKQTGSIPVAATTATVNVLDVVVEHYRDFKCEWVNGGTTQTAFEIDMALVPDRAATTV